MKLLVSILATLLLLVAINCQREAPNENQQGNNVDLRGQVMPYSEKTKWNKDNNARDPALDEDKKIVHDHTVTLEALRQAALKLVNRLDKDQDTSKLATKTQKVGLKKLDGFIAKEENKEKYKNNPNKMILLNRLKDIRNSMTKSKQFTISLTHGEHWDLKSTGNKEGAAQFRNKQAKLLSKGRFADALKMGIKQYPNTKQFNEGIKRMVTKYADRGSINTNQRDRLLKSERFSDNGRNRQHG